MLASSTRPTSDWSAEEFDGELSDRVRQELLDGDDIVDTDGVEAV